MDRRVRPGRAQPDRAWAARRTRVVNDSIVQEIDVKTGLVMWEWHALGHIPLRDSYAPMPHTSVNWDYVHVNSIDPGSDGDVLLSARSTWAIYDVNMHTGGVHLADRRASTASFKRGPGTFFYWQHDAELAARRPGLGVRQRLRRRPRRSSRAACARPQHGDPHGHARQAVHEPQRDAARLEPGRPAEPAGRQLADGLRRAAELHRVRQLRAASCFDAHARAPTSRTSAPTSRRGARSRRRRPAIAAQAAGTGGP